MEKRIMTKKDWSEIETIKLLEMAIAGDTILGAARHFATTEYHVKKRAEQMGITFAQHRLSVQGKEFIREHFGVDMTPTEIAKAIGFTTSTVYYWAEKFGLYEPGAKEAEDSAGETSSPYRLHKPFWQLFGGLTSVDLDTELLLKAGLRDVLEHLSDFGKKIFLSLCLEKGVGMEQFKLFQEECKWQQVPLLEAVSAGKVHKAFLKNMLAV